MTPNEILLHYLRFHPELVELERQARAAIPKTGKAVYPYQAAILYDYAKSYNGKRILEIGTAYGYSCFYLAAAAPASPIVTLNTSAAEVEMAQKNLARFPNVDALEFASWDYFSVTSKFNRAYGLIFVDGDHKQIKRDLPWFNRLEVGGLILFHDYSPQSSARPCPPVYRAINEMGNQLGRQPDVLIMDNDRVGLAGFIRQEGEEWQP